jgi:hypothetical protein
MAGFDNPFDFISSHLSISPPQLLLLFELDTGIQGSHAFRVSYYRVRTSI